ncbi:MULTISPECIES: hypothetical protein [unclassified Mycobacterium]|uniref:hypothetical protein n=1 Tax=unclassified Mycobacterium TaxID=2642494 RepID=UPI0029C991A5|nr:MULTISPECIES: hypothetical protein [unclassified Mycobacterium]
MSMPRDELASHGHARFVGRVGALAVALGIGAAIANSPGLASADPNDSDSSASSSSGTDSPGTTPSKTGTAGEQSADPTDANPKLAGEHTSTVEPAAEPTKPAGLTSEPATGDESPNVKSKKPRRQLQPNSAARSAESEQQSGEEQAPAAEQPTAVASGDADETTQSTAPSVKATAVQTLSVPAAELKTAEPSDGPATPPPSPTLWTMLGWVRREVGHVVAPATGGEASAVATTSFVEPAAALASTSVLGTQEQLTAEQIATETLNTLPMQLMKLVLRFGFMSAAQQQFPDGPDQANVDQLDAAVNEYAMGAAFQQQILDSMNPTVVMQVAPPHTWYGQVVPGSRILYDNPDTIYRFMGVNGASSYVITGRFADLDHLPADTTFSVLTGLTGNTASVLTKDQLVLNPDGTFTITADSTPANGRPNHLQLTNDTTLIATRNTLSDWTNQQPMSLEIARVGGPPSSLFSQLGGFAIPGIGPLVVGNPLLQTLVSLVPPLPYTPPLLRGTVAAVIMALGIQRESTYMAVATTDPETGQPREANVLTNPTRNAEFLATQLQSAGHFQLADDEALVLTIDPGDANYFVVPVTNDWTITDDYWNQQTSLNNVQAKPFGGVYTIVISPTDPLVENWVSTGGLNQGTISIRFQDLPLEPTRLPTVHSQVVPLSELASVLPAGTVYVTPDERTAQLAARKAGYDNRFAPYPQP